MFCFDLKILNLDNNRIVATTGEQRSDDESDDDSQELIATTAPPGANLAVKIYTQLSRKELFQRIADPIAGVPGNYFFKKTRNYRCNIFFPSTTFDFPIKIILVLFNYYFYLMYLFIYMTNKLSAT
jgi:hypothetical protein